MTTFLNFENIVKFLYRLLQSIADYTTVHPLCTVLLAPLAAKLLYSTIQYLVALPRVPRIPRRYVLVTGCGRGLGNDIAKRLDSLGCYVFAGCRSERGMDDLDRETSDRCHVIRMDVSKPESVREAFHLIKSKIPPGEGLWGLVNNAGISGGKSGPIDWLTLDDYREVLEVNLLGTVDVTMTFLPLIKITRGRIINFSSTMAMIALPFAANYAVSKFGIEGFSDGLRRFLNMYGCKVIILRPGMFKTHLVADDNVAEIVQEAWKGLPQEVKGNYGDDYVPKYIKSIRDSSQYDFGNQISHVSDTVEQALFSRYPRARYMIGKDIKYFYSVIAALPEWLSDWIMEKLTAVPLPRDAELYKK